MGRHRRLRPIIFAAGGRAAGRLRDAGRPARDGSGPGTARCAAADGHADCDRRQPQSFDTANESVRGPGGSSAHGVTAESLRLAGERPLRTARDIGFSSRTETTAKALAAIPQREWIRRRLEQLQVGGRTGVPDNVVVERGFYVASDGTRLRMEIAHRRDVARDGNQPTLLTVDHPTAKPPGPLLEPFVLVWLEMGGVYARAEVRNSLVPEPTSPRAATSSDKPIALSDLFAAAQSLIDRHYTRRARLGVYGRGFGGLMAGAAVALRPDLFGAALPTGTWEQYSRITTGSCFPPTLITTAERDGNISAMAGLRARGSPAGGAGLRPSSDPDAGRPGWTASGADSGETGARRGRAGVRGQVAGGAARPIIRSGAALQGGGASSSSCAGARSTASSGAGSPGMVCFSVSHAPRSMSLQRSLQKGRKGDCRPVDLTLAGGTLDVRDGHHAQQVRRNFTSVSACVARSPRALPAEEAHVAAVVAAAHLRVKPHRGRQRDPQELQRILAVESNGEVAALGGFLPRAPVLPGQPDELGDGIAQWSQHRQPLVEGPDPDLVRLRQPIEVIRQVELAGATGDAAAVLDGVEEVRVFSGCRFAMPAFSSSERSRVRFVIRALSRLASTPGFDWNSPSRVSWRSSSFSASERTSLRVMIARMSIRLDTAARVPHWLAASLW